MPKLGENEKESIFNKLSNNNTIFEEARSKQNVLYVSVKRLIATCTVGSVHKKTKAKGATVLLGTVQMVSVFRWGLYYP